ncbi:MAG TPA: serine/threonine-protein kinase [Gemmatimonadales bacterium]|nr:serine/threonine-protein kinase [Gemmatimonadales bacterium]
MTPPNLIRRRSTSAPSALGGLSSGSGVSLPSEVLAQTCRRIHSVGMAFAILWSVPLLLFLLVAPHVDSMPMLAAQLWPMPGAVIAGTGLVCSLLLMVVSPRFSAKPELQLFLGSAFLVVTSFLFGLLEFWVPEFNRPQATFIGIAILAYSSIVPNEPGRTLAVGLLAATMAPLGYLVTLMRGVQVEATWFHYLIAFLPNYMCALLAVIPAKIIRQLGHQVKKARELGSYRLEELLGKGGMGEVYKASHQLLARHAAVKLIKADSLANDPDRARVMIERFRREAEASASLRSPHTISLYDFGVSSDGTFFFVMELLDGLDLESLVQRFGPLDPARVVYLLRQACESLEEAHRRGLIHRDIKPSNIFTCRMGLAVDFVKVLDFGLVKTEREHTDVRLTAPNTTTGTPAYMAPEVVLGTLPADHRIDIYALGCVAYWLLTGQLVFEGGTSMQQLLRHAHDQPVPPSHRSELPIPKALDDVILAALAKNPDQRPQSAAQFGGMLLDAIPEAERWNDERAEQWWMRHHPESARPEPTCCDGLTLSKLGEGWVPTSAEPGTAALAEVTR